ncbi:unnamed protein product [Ilex paraguariensis]|uniref:Uncharacterized protein n=1 Tax=Ilex paraguariensis TaxID=185542 RepID=A0ABC8QYP7_9AQUA
MGTVVGTRVWQAQVMLEQQVPWARGQCKFVRVPGAISAEDMGVATRALELAQVYESAWSMGANRGAGVGLDMVVGAQGIVVGVGTWTSAPPRADVVKSLKNGIILNLLGMGAAILGMQATVGILVAKALTTSANPYYQGISPGSSPVLALDVFLVQASANTILSHFLGLVCSLELLRSVTLPTSESIPVPKVA